MRIRRGYLNWGIFLVCLGAVPLVVQMGWIASPAAAEVARLWPLVLIGGGLGLVLRFTRFATLGGVVVAGTFGLLAGSFLSGGFGVASTACVGGQAGGPVQAHNGIAQGQLQLDIEVTCGDMDVSRSAGSAWKVDVQAGNETPLVEASGTRLRMRSQPQTGVAPLGSGRELWAVMVPTDATLSTSLTINAGTLDMVLGGGAVGDISATYNAADGLLDLSGATGDRVSLSATLNAASLDLALPSSSLTGSLTLNAASLEMCVPADVGLRVSYSDTLSSHNFGSAGMTQVGSSWQTANYATAGARADMQISATVSSLTINPAGGCQ